MAYVACNSSLILNPGGGGGGSSIQLFEVLANGNNAQGRDILGVDNLVATGLIASAQIVSTGLATLQSISTTTIASSAQSNLQSLNTQQIQCSGALQADSISVGGDLQVLTDCAVSGILDVIGNSSFSGELDVIGDTTLTNAQLSGNLIVNGNCSVDGTLITNVFAPNSVSTLAFTLAGSPYPAFPQPDASYGVGVVKIFANGSGLTVGDFAVGSNTTVLNVVPPAGVYMLKSEFDVGNARGAGYVVKINVFYAGVLVGFDNIVVNAVTGIVTTCYPCVALFRSTGLSALTMRFDVIASTDGGTVGIALDSDVDLIRLF